MNWSVVPGLIAALSFAALVVLLAIPLIKTGRVLEELRKSVQQMTEQTAKILDEAANTVSGANSQLDNINTVTTAAAETSQNISALAALVSSTLGRPLVKVGAFSYGVRRAFAIRRSPASGKEGSAKKDLSLKSQGQGSES